MAWNDEARAAITALNTAIGKGVQEVAATKANADAMGDDLAAAKAEIARLSQVATPPVPPVPSSARFKSPAADTVLSGVIKQSSIEVEGSGINGVQFFLDDVALNVEVNAPYLCDLDTTKFSDGPHTLKAVVTFTTSGPVTLTLPVGIKNVGVTPEPPPPPTTATAIEAADILISVRGDKPFAQQSRWTATAMGKSSSAQNMAESGFMDRITKVPDPTDASKKVLSILLNPDDPKTSGSKRTEISCDKVIDMEKVYWCGLSVYHFTFVDEFKPGLYGVQFHASVAGSSPSISINVSSSKSFRIETHCEGEDHGLRHGDHPIKFNSWQDFVFKFCLSLTKGFVQVWEDGKQIVDYRGKLGYNTTLKSYPKHGTYLWQGLILPRRLLLRNPTTIFDPTGAKYSAEQIRSYIKESL